MLNIFRGDKIEINKKIYDLEFKAIKDIFKFDDTPYLCIGKSKGGKTTFAVDIIHKFGQESSKIFYISATQQMIGEDSIMSIPKLFTRDPKFETLNNIWSDIKESCEYVSATEEQLLNVLTRIYPSDIQRQLSRHFKTWRNSNACKDEDSKTIAAVEVLSRLVLNGIDIYGDKRLTSSDIVLVQSLISTEQKTILIIDDVSAELEQMKTSNEKVIFNGAQLPVKKAYTALLIDILTKARRYNCIVVMFLHSWNILDVKSMISNFIVIDQNAVDNLQNIRTVGENTRKLVQEAAKKIFGIYKYHVIVCKGGEDVFVTKADLNTTNELQLDELNKRLVKAYNSVVENLEYTDTTTQSTTNTLDELI